MRKLFIITTIFLVACNVGEKPLGNYEYYSLDSLVNAQTSLLGELNPRLRKQVMLNNEPEDTVLQFSQEEWENELRLFKEADINIPSYSGIYQLQNELEDPNSNLLIDRYEPLEGEEVHIRYFEIYYYRSIDQVKKVIVEESEENELYFSNKLLELYFATNDGKSVLSRYKITGNQKLISKDSVKYTIEGNILPD